jgi:hypothetical protein
VGPAIPEEASSKISDDEVAAEYDDGDGLGSMYGSDGSEGVHTVQPGQPDVFEAEGSAMQPTDAMQPAVAQGNGMLPSQSDAPKQNGKSPLVPEVKQDDESERDTQSALFLSLYPATAQDGAGSSRSHGSVEFYGHDDISKASIMRARVVFGDHVLDLQLDWRQLYVTFVNDLKMAMAKSDSVISKQHAALPYQDFRSTIRWQGCKFIPSSNDSFSMHEVVHPLGDDDEDTVKDHRLFQVNIVPLQVTNHGVPNLFGAEDIVTTMLENMKPWYEPRNLRVLVAFSATCWGALKVVRLVIGGATTDVTPHLPSPWFHNGRPSVLEAHHQWQPSLDRWLLPWRQIKRDYDNLELWIENEPLRVEVMDRLHSNRWMHQDTINAFMTLLSARVDQCPEVTYFAHTQVFRGLFSHGWQQVKRWFKPWRRTGRKAAKIRVFYFPINVSEIHWIGAKVVQLLQAITSTFLPA